MFATAAPACRYASLLLLCALPSLARAEVLGEATRGEVPLKSIHVLAFADDGVLLIGDGAGAQIFAIATGDRNSAAKLTANTAIDDLAAKLAAPLGTTAKGIEVVDMVVNPLSGKAYFAVTKQDDKAHVLLTVDGAGQVEIFDLREVRYARAALDAGEAKVSRITDIAWADDRIVAAARSNEEFASKIFSVPVPLKHNASSAAISAETYHVSHRRWETKAPMSVVIPFRENDKTYVVGAFSCTPIVKYPLDSVQPGARVKGSSMIELGSGNRPVDMFVYQRGDKQYVLANTFRFHHERKPFGPSPYWTVKFEQDLLSGDREVNEQAVRRLKGNDQPATDRIEMVPAFHGVKLMDKLDAAHAVVIREAADGDQLAVLPLP